MNTAGEGKEVRADKEQIAICSSSLIQYFTQEKESLIFWKVLNKNKLQQVTNRTVVAI